MAPSLIEDSANQREALSKLPPPTLYPVKEAKFDKYIRLRWTDMRGH
jgi:actin-related protein 5